LTHPNLRYIRCNIVESISIECKRSWQMVRSSGAPFRQMRLTCGNRQCFCPFQL
jgi:hypothetical protein